MRPSARGRRGPAGRRGLPSPVLPTSDATRHWRHWRIAPCRRHYDATHVRATEACGPSPASVYRLRPHRASVVERSTRPDRVPSHAGMAARIPGLPCPARAVPACRTTTVLLAPLALPIRRRSPRTRAASFGTAQLSAGAAVRSPRPRPPRAPTTQAAPPRPSGLSCPPPPSPSRASPRLGAPEVRVVCVV